MKKKAKKRLGSLSDPDVFPLTPDYGCTGSQLSEFAAMIISTYGPSAKLTMEVARCWCDYSCDCGDLVVEFQREAIEAERKHQQLLDELMPVSEDLAARQKEREELIEDYLRVSKIIDIGDGLKEDFLLEKEEELHEIQSRITGLEGEIRVLYGDEGKLKRQIAIAAQDIPLYDN